jgi:uncharacterized membrane protein
VKTLWRSILIQALGSGATVLCALAITTHLGLAAQGQFGLLRTWNDALVSLAVLGLPQGLLQLQYRDWVAPRALLGWTLRHAAKVAWLLASVGLMVWLWSPSQPPWGAWPWWIWFVLMAGVPASAIHLLWRALLLRGVSAVRYAWITAAPAALMLCGVLVVCALKEPLYLAWSLLLSAVGSTLICAGALQRMLARPTTPEPTQTTWSRQTLWSVGVENGLQNTLIALSPALLLSTLNGLGTTLSQLGIVAWGLHVYQLFAISANYIAPTVYDRWSRHNQEVRASQLWRQFQLRWHRRHLAVVMVLIAAGLTAVFWGAIKLDVKITLVLMPLAGLCAFATRMLSTLLLAQSRLRPLTYQAVLRCMMMVFGPTLLTPSCGGVLAATLTLLGTEMMVLYWLWR